MNFTCKASVGFSLAILSGLWLMSGAASPMQGGARQLPEGPGKVTMQRTCGGCHAPEIVIGKHLSKEGWEQLVSSMVEKGATGTDEEFNQVIDYLAANFPDTKSPDSKSPETKPAQ